MKKATIKSVEVTENPVNIKMSFNIEDYNDDYYFDFGIVSDVIGYQTKLNLGVVNHNLPEMEMINELGRENVQYIVDYISKEVKRRVGESRIRSMITNSKMLFIQ